jgi:hypothetical protein
MKVRITSNKNCMAAAGARDRARKLDEMIRAEDGAADEVAVLAREVAS